MPPEGLGIDTWPHDVAARLLDLSADLACVAGFDGYLRQVTGEWTALLGWSAQVLLSRPLLEFVHPEDVAATSARLEAARGGRAIARFQNRFLTAGGAVRWLAWTAIGVPGEGAYRAVARDLTPRHEAEALVHESERRYLDLIESAHDIVQSILPDGHLEFVNHAWHTHLGYTPEELPDLTLFDIVDEADHDHCTILIGQIMSGLSFDHVEITFVAKDGHTFPVEGNATGRFRDGVFVATHTFFRDISDRRRAEALQADYRRRLENEVAERSAALVQSEKLATLGRLSAGMAHELNNPAAAARRGALLLEEAFTATCTALLTLARSAQGAGEAARLAELLGASATRASDAVHLDPLARGDREAEVEDWLAAHWLEDQWEAAGALVDLGMDAAGLDALADTFAPGHLGAAITALSRARTAYGLIAQIGHGSERISRIVAALKEYSYMDRAPVQDVDVHDGLDSTLVMLQSKLTQGIEVRRDYGRDVPRIETLGSELNQVWTNLIDNAADAMGGSGHLTIRTRAAAGGGVAVEIEDDGPGIPGEVVADVFDPFFTTKPPGQGTGLGLNIVFNMITGSGGTVDVRSEPGRTVFRVWLPPRRPQGEPA
ncbi:PAS domain S-box protein [Pseudactinotalea sp. HY158]|uniref:PAS domain S-box protein n=1 Tax=Pseudactinotalea sp. HY158 TaxID=2654547 RepID=UPI00129C5F31|nr:PAS domain S-box protein [Pseudactinotalea sp. HY158]QGH69462.1 PAS domain S-box protein [Pseudactinotalea sp. HY158]